MALSSFNIGAADRNVYCARDNVFILENRFIPRYPYPLPKKGVHPLPPPRGSTDPSAGRPADDKSPAAGEPPGSSPLSNLIYKDQAPELPEFFLLSEIKFLNMVYQLFETEEAIWHYMKRMMRRSSGPDNGKV